MVESNPKQHKIQINTNAILTITLAKRTKLKDKQAHCKQQIRSHSLSGCEGDINEDGMPLVGFHHWSTGRHGKYLSGVGEVHLHNSVLKEQEKTASFTLQKNRKGKGIT